MCKVRSQVYIRPSIEYSTQKLHSAKAKKVSNALYRITTSLKCSEIEQIKFRCQQLSYNSRSSAQCFTSDSWRIGNNDLLMKCRLTVF